ncbi:Kinesin-like protein [Spironucleus salmonicida]|uniref:Kinesin-like protein n=1 Tax=Spironucleus salmonicida TaxID=348837 RepID=V6LQW1_9EUKA|nr:Kinesin-like protein [Spironucleus salmonicida]|eukprot:EST46091.1 Kinesin-16 [Spironucleus salmonicida]
MSDNFQVLLRVRPMIQREQNNNDAICISINDTQISLKETTGNQLFDEFSQLYQFNFDKIFDSTSENEDIFDQVQPLLTSFLEGYNATIMCYGLTSSGKTYTMLGILPQCISYILNNTDSVITVSYVQIYNEQLQDLLDDPQKGLKIRETPKNEIYVENLSQYLVKTLEDVIQLLEIGLQNRKTAATVFNEISSRSHTILTINLEGKETKSKIQFVDLAGSEKIVNQDQKQQRETSNINKSLNALGNVIFALTESKNQHVPYRDSILTRILQDSIGSNCLSQLIVCLSPASSCFYETLNSIRFAERAKKIKQKAQKNVIVDDEGIIGKLEKQICQLKQDLEILQRNQSSDVNNIMHKNQLQFDINNIEYKLKNGGNLTQENIIDDIKLKVNQKQASVGSVAKFQKVLERQTETLVHLSSRIQDRNQQISGLQIEISALDHLERQLEHQLCVLTMAGQFVQGVNLQQNIPEIEAGLNVQARQIAVFEKEIQLENQYIQEIDKLLKNPTQVKEIIQQEVKSEDNGMQLIKKYYNEQKALIILIKNKFAVMLSKVANGEQQSQQPLIQLCKSTIQALEGTKNDYQ